MTEQILIDEFAKGEWEEILYNLGCDITPSIISAMKKYAKLCIIESLQVASQKLPYDSLDEKMLLEIAVNNESNIILS